MRVPSVFVRLLNPGVPEPLPLTHLRKVARTCAYASAVLLMFNPLVVFLFDAYAEQPREQVWTFVFGNGAGHVLSVVLNGVLLRRSQSELAFRRGAMVTSFALAFSTTMSLWIGGSVTNYLSIGIMSVLIVGARLFYDARIGNAMMLSVLGLHGGLVLLQALGVVTPTPLPALANIPIYGEPRLLGLQFARIVCLYVLAFVHGSIVATRYRRSEYALRLATDAREKLRAQVARVERMTALPEDGELPSTGQGRLSGSLLAGLYELGELLGSGGMGEVYDAVQLDDGTSVAIKVLRPQFSADEQTMARFRREAEIAARLPGQHVAQVLEYGVSPQGQHFIVMERLRGEDLAACLRRRSALPIDELLGLLDQLAEALDAAHAQGIVHRDLKPNNVFLVEGTRGTETRLLDFGIARLSGAVGGPETRQGILGTPGFLAPEQARGDSQRIGPHTDVFAMATLAYRALTGRHAFPARNLAEAVHEALYFFPPPPSTLLSDLPHDVDAVFSVAMAKAPELRHGRVSEFVRELREASQGRLSEAGWARARAVEVAMETQPMAQHG